MKRLLILVILLLVAPVLALSQHVLPWANDLTWHSDTLHVTTTEKGWPLGSTSGAYYVIIINPNSNYLLFRFDTDVAATLHSYIGNYGTGPLQQPYVLAVPHDSVFIDGEANCTVYLEWYSVD